MGMMDKFKNMFNMSEEEFLDDVEKQFLFRP